MKAAVHDRYGGPEVVRVTETPDPVPGPGQVLVRVHAAALTTADWRTRASAFPGGLWLPGRLMTGLFRPRNRIPGHAFAGTITALGPGASGFQPGDRVFGFAPHGAHAEYLAIKADAAIAPMPEGLSFEEAAALPFGGDTALSFLRDIANLRPGQSVLILGASGATGGYAVQIARAMGATVTAVASGPNEAFVRRLGAHDFIDYRTTDPLATGATYDVVFDTVGATVFARAKKALKPDGQFVPLNFSVADALRAVAGRLAGGKTMRIAVSGDSRATLDDLAEMVRTGTLRPLVDRVLPLEEIREAHRLIETRHRRGTLVLRVAGGSVAPQDNTASA